MSMEPEVPETVYVMCPVCGEHEVHDVLKGRPGKSSLEATLRCHGCNRVRAETVRMPKVIAVPVVASDGPDSYRSSVGVEEDERISVGDEFFDDSGNYLRVTAIESNTGARPKKAVTREIRTIWAQRFDVISVKVTVNQGTVSHSRRIRAEPGDEFFIGQKLELEDMDCYVNAIKTRQHLKDRGSAEAREIVRVYGRFAAKTYPVLDFEDDA
ncbi:MAG: hypothetical protein GX224_01325 [Thermoplasmatales archaeon]|nr:hypothetical protein [Thermoplasmatales archaeon]